MDFKGNLRSQTLINQVVCSLSNEFRLSWFKYQVKHNCVNIQTDFVSFFLFFRNISNSWVLSKCKELLFEVEFIQLVQDSCQELCVPKVIFRHHVQRPNQLAELLLNNFMCETKLKHSILNHILKHTNTVLDENLFIWGKITNNFICFWKIKLK